MIFSDGLKATGEIVQETPQDFFDFMNKIFRFDLDVCALPENAKCKRFYTPEDDGLKQPWGGDMVQSTLRERHHQLGQEGFRGIQEAILQFHCHASSCENRYEVVSRICLSVCIPMVYRRPS